MNRRTLVQTVGLLAAGLALGLPAGAGEKAAPKEAGPYRISGPYVYENLTIFLIHGQDQLKGKNFLTLQEALEQKKVVVHETKNVNQLTIENTSGDVEIYIQSGEILKGGQQDRAIAYDMVVPSKSGKLPIASFCVEQGRWTRRGNESVRQFDASANALPSKEGKLAVKGAARPRQQAEGRPTQGNARPTGRATPNLQGAVWNEVTRKQMMLARALGRSVQSNQSKSSLQLTLENKKLLEAVDGYTKKLRSLLEGKKDVIGYAFAINGQINSADVYASGALFQKLWPKLLAATVVEAISERQKDKKFEPVKEEVIKAFLQDADRGKAANTDLTKRVRLICQETKKNVVFTTQDQANKGVALHKNYIAK